MFDHASSLYTHSAQKHYYSQLVELSKTNFMKVNGMCTLCPNRPISDSQVRKRGKEGDPKKHINDTGMEGEGKEERKK